ncbi:UDP-N-acetylmuramoyl-tripeptide--D-alanyl-D-alanine ligase [Marinomonas sp. 15G1-11]|uniref:UDP-N-acetylmuramoyl-tripeptide--D-alanyl-D-alanine ligase n=1 Tax=Marinomonas phaeophyticola TaxID=3004091 RepID=A0ABT4JZ96_9GAMM|nr:UDP-N-acetylmuramoyl-tripeptide--D-alanyl-D-alanine ligase [Marinomonas sp. 15G1-11]MCZ2723093.1 UDP-N-acetylmuramoyl-tripeptide--D-alanyl-D-alanine ligase [Marinomonas sp. 15G1-11]
MLIDLFLSKIAEICQGELIGDDVLISSVETNSKESKISSLFVALKGDRFDGHDYVSQAFENGFLAALVSQDVGVSPAIVVNDTLTAYGEIARYIRHSFKGKVVAVTGSNGKTTVKEWLSHIVSEHNGVLKTKNNENNQVGVPKTLLDLSEDHQVAIIETGTSYPGEIEKMGRVITPDIAVLTNASGCHYSGFGTLDAIAKEKGALLSSTSRSGSVVLNKDDPFYVYWAGLAKGRVIRSFGFDNDAQLWVDDILLCDDHSVARFHYKGESVLGRVGSPGRHQIANGMAVVQVLLCIGWTFKSAVLALADSLVIPGRLQKIYSENRPLLLNDCYNASPKSVNAAIDVLQCQKVENTVLVLGALGELGALEASVHQEIGRYAFQSGVSCLIALGPVAGIASSVFSSLGGKAYVFDTHSEISQKLKELNDSSAVLIKGSRSAQMEKVIEDLDY